MKKVTAICAVKGGVGKTTIALNIAHQLNQAGMKVGLIDCDLDNSNFATFTGIEDEMFIDENKLYEPYDWNGVKVFSMSLLAGRNNAVSMTGDRYAQILDDAVKLSKWGDTEYFVLDLPAGSGDIFKMAMTEFVDNLIGNIIVCQPSMKDATMRTVNIHKYLKIPILGLIENMSFFTCEAHKTPKVYYPFGESTLDMIAKDSNVPALGKIPLSESIAKGIIKGDPILPPEYSSPILKAVDVITKAEVVKTELTERMGKTTLGKIKFDIQKLFVTLLLKVKQDFNISELRRESGFIHEKPFRLIITDETGRAEIMSAPMKLTEDGFKVIKRPKKVEFDILMSYKTLARVVMGQRKEDGELVPFRPLDAWLMGDIRVYGTGHSTMAVEAWRNVFSDENIMGAIREKYGDILKRWL